MPTYVCPTCNRIIRVERHEHAPGRPFCSLRCQMIDLAKWLDEEYRISEPLESPGQVAQEDTQDTANPAT